jgi:hypothetical protein
MHPRIQTILAAVALAATAAHAAERLAYQSRYSPSCPADLTNDGVVDDSDFVQFADAYNTLDCADPAMPAGCPADLNADVFVDDSDFVLFATAYNELLCPPGEVILRDSIGPDNTLTNGQRVVNTWVSSPPSYDYVSFSIVPDHDIVISELLVVVASPTGSSPGIVWSAFDYIVRIWNSPQARSSNPIVGNVLDFMFPYPSNFPDNDHAPTMFGNAVGVVPFNLGTSSFLISFDFVDDINFNYPPVSLSAGVEYVFSIQPIRPTFVNTTMGVVTSRESGIADFRYSSPSPAGVPVSFYSTPSLPLTGRVGFRVVGVRQ